MCIIYEKLNKVQSLLNLKSMLPHRDNLTLALFLRHNVSLRVYPSLFTPTIFCILHLLSLRYLSNASYTLRPSKTHASTSYPGRGLGVAEGCADLWTHCYGNAGKAYTRHSYIKQEIFCGNSNRLFACFHDELPYLEYTCDL